MTIFNRNYICKGSIFHCYVSLPECIYVNFQVGYPRQFDSSPSFAGATCQQKYEGHVSPSEMFWSTSSTCSSLEISQYGKKNTLDLLVWWLDRNIPLMVVKNGDLSWYKVKITLNRQKLLNTKSCSFRRLFSFSNGIFPDCMSVFRGSKNFPTYPWNIPQTPKQQFV